MINLEDPKFWPRVRLGATIELTDKRTLRECVEGNKQEGGGLGKKYAVQQVEVSTNEIGAKWFFFLLDRDKSLYLMVRTFNGDVAFYVIFKPSEFECGDREFLNREQDNVLGHFLFKNPLGRADFKANDLEFADFFSNCGVQIEGVPEPVDFDYKKQAFGTVFCETQDSNHQGVKLFTQITEYVCENEHCEENFALVRETTKNVDNPRGGYVELMLGSEVSVGDLEVIQ